MGAPNNQPIQPFNPQGGQAQPLGMFQQRLAGALSNGPQQPAKGAKGGARPGAAGLLDQRVPLDKPTKGGAVPGGGVFKPVVPPSQGFNPVVPPTHIDPSQVFNTPSLPGPRPAVGGGRIGPKKSIV
jgi:hypothetical protein